MKVLLVIALFACVALQPIYVPLLDDEARASSTMGAITVYCAALTRRLSAGFIFEFPFSHRGCYLRAVSLDDFNSTLESRWSPHGESILAAPRPDDDKKVEPVVLSDPVVHTSVVNAPADAPAPTEAKPMEAAVEAVSSNAASVAANVEEKKP